MGFTAEEKFNAAERECQQRRKVYPRLVEAGRMSQRSADYQIAIMEAIAADYRKLSGADLFAEIEREGT